MSAVAMAVAAGALQQARTEHVEVKESVARQLNEASNRCPQKASPLWHITILRTRHLACEYLPGTVSHESPGNGLS